MSWFRKKPDVPTRVPYSCATSSVMKWVDLHCAYIHQYACIHISSYIYICVPLCVYYGGYIGNLICAMVSRPRPYHVQASHLEASAALVVASWQLTIFGQKLFMYSMDL